MIKYKLTCKDCSKLFDSWFASSKEFEKLKKLNYLNCPFCNSFNIDKSLMSPSVLVAKKQKNSFNEQKYKDVRKKIKEYQKFIKNNFDYVGENFTYEARSIHYGKKKKKKGIYGNASLREIKELKEEGIETETIPWIDDNEN
jgi:hypothetical protein|tara:strand:- start:163 stop:588 length:426 start_codon:yes stop_codon:yes gene_type:complete